MHDGGRVEVDAETRQIVTWGPRGLADQLTSRLVELEDFSFRRQEKSGTCRHPDTPRRRPRPLSEETTTALADRWRGRGFNDVIEDEACVWITLDDGTRLHDAGDHVEIHGPITDEAISVLVGKAEAEWNGGLRLTGPWTDEACARTWLQCQRQGVALTDYIPSPALLAKWEAERASDRGAATALRPSADRAFTDQPLLVSATSSPAPDTDVPEPTAADRRAQQLGEIERQLQQKHALWRTHANDRDVIERARVEIEQLEERRRRLLGQTVRLHDEGNEHESGHSSPR